MTLPSRRRTARGFTLVELLVVLAILGLLAGLVGPKLMAIFANSKTKAAGLQIKELSNTLDVFYLDVGRYPTTSEGLTALIQPPGGAANWNGPYLKNKEVPKDPWGHDYHYTQPGQDGRPYDIESLGSDNSQGGTGEAQDVGSWQ